jgi:hypothetical protein
LPSLGIGHDEQRLPFTKAGVRNQLLTISSNTHGGFTDEQMLNAYSAIREFLLKSNPPVHGQ